MFVLSGFFFFFGADKSLKGLHEDLCVIDTAIFLATLASQTREILVGKL